MQDQDDLDKKLERIRPELALLDTGDKSATDLLTFLWEKFPPKIADVQKPDWTSDPKTISKALVKTILAYHPDKNIPKAGDEESYKWSILCGEIVKKLNARYEAFN